MNKKLSSILFALALFGIIVAYIAYQPRPSGDANNDGIVDLADAACIAADIGSATSSCEGDGANSDVNGDGQIDMADLELVSGAYRE